MNASPSPSSSLSSSSPLHGSAAPGAVRRAGSEPTRRGGAGPARGGRRAKLRKPQSSSRLDGLAEELRARLEVWLLEENRSYEAVRDLLAAEHGVTTTTASLCRYYRRWLAPRREARRAWEARTRAVFSATGGAEAVLARAQQLLFESLTRPEPDVETARRLLDMITAMERTRLAQARQGEGDPQ